MPKGQAIEPHEARQILIDAASTSIKEAAQRHGITTGTVYQLTYRFPDAWKEFKERMRPVVEVSNYETWALARSLLQQQLEAPNAVQAFKPGELARIMQVCSIQFERFHRMDALKLELSEIIAKIREAIRKGHLDALELMREMTVRITPEELDEIERHMRQSNAEGPKNTQPPA